MSVFCDVNCQPQEHASVAGNSQVEVVGTF